METNANLMNMTAALVRAGRAILKLSAAELAERCGVSRSTVIDFESGNSDKRARGLNKASRIALARFFQDAGIEFVGGDAPGLVIRRPELLD